MGRHIDLAGTGLTAVMLAAVGGVGFFRCDDPGCRATATDALTTGLHDEPRATFTFADIVMAAVIVTGAP